MERLLPEGDLERFFEKLHSNESKAVAVKFALDEGREIKPEWAQIAIDSFGRLEEAIGIALKTATWEFGRPSHNGNAFQNAARFMEGAGEREKAKALYNKALDAYEREKPPYMAAKIARDLGRHEKAAELEARSLLEGLEQGQIRSINEHVEKVMNSEPTRSKAVECMLKKGYFDLALELALQNSDKQLAEEVYSKGMRELQEKGDLGAAARLAEMAGEKELGQQLMRKNWEKDLEKYENDENNYLYASSVAEKLGNLGKARELKQKAVKYYEEKAVKYYEEKGSFEWLNKAARLSEKLGDLERAVELYGKAIDDSEKRGLPVGVADSAIELARLWKRIGNDEKASELYSKALDSQTKHEMFGAVAKLMKELGRTDEATAFEEKQLKKYEQEGSFTSAIEIAKQMLDAKSLDALYDRAIEQSIKKATSKEPTTGIITDYYGSGFLDAIALAKQQGEKADKVYERAISFFEEQKYFLRALEFAKRQGNEDRIRAVCVNAIEYYGNRNGVRIAFEENCDYLRNYEKELMRLLEYRGSYYAAAQSAEALGFLDKVNELYAKAIAEFEGGNELVFAACAAKRVGLDDKAAELYARQVDKFESSTSWMEAAELLVQIKGDYARAMENFKRAGLSDKHQFCSEKRPEIEQGKWHTFDNIDQESLYQIVLTHFRGLGNFESAAKLAEMKGDPKAAELYEQQIACFEDEQCFAQAARLAAERGDKDRAKLYGFIAKVFPEPLDTSYSLPYYTRYSLPHL